MEQTAAHCVESLAERRRSGGDCEEEEGQGNEGGDTVVLKRASVEGT